MRYGIKSIIKNMNILRTFVCSTMVFAVALLAATQAYSQGKKSKNKISEEEKATAIANRWKTELGLSEAETQAYYQAKLTQLNNSKAIAAKHKGNKEAMRGEMKAVNQTFVSQIQASLTPEHFQLWQQKRKEAAQKMKEKRQKVKTEKDKKTPASENESFDLDSED